MAKEIIDVVNENDEVIGQEDRDVVHQKGLTHRHVHVWLYNDKGQIVLQRRSKTAASQPGLLDPAAGGHVPAGMDVVEAALMELKEETGIRAQPGDLKLFKKYKVHSEEPNRNIVNDVFNIEFGYKYNSDIAALKSEAKYGEETGIGFELWNIDDILNLNDESLRARFVKSLLSENNLEMLRDLKNSI